MIASHGQLNFVWAALIGAALAALVGALVALPVRRLGALVLALSTFAVAFAADLLFFSYEPIGHGSGGWTIRPPTLDIPVLNDVADLVMNEQQDFLDFSQPQQQVLMLLVVFGLATLLFHSLARSASGRAMLAVRSSDVAARTVGISPARQKVVLFALSGAIAGFGGAFYGLVNFSISRSSVPPLLGLVWIAIAVTFGIRRPGGALLAGLAFACSAQIFEWIGTDFLGGTVQDLTTSQYFTPILFGLGAINLAKNPDGVLAMVGHDRLEKKRAKERQAVIEQAEADGARRRRCRSTSVCTPRASAAVPRRRARRRRCRARRCRASSPGTATSRCCTASTSPCHAGRSSRCSVRTVPASRRSVRGGRRA